MYQHHKLIKYSYNNKIWYEDILNVFNIDNAIKFIPMSNTTIEEQLNAVWLFSLYFCILVFLYNGKIQIFLIFVFVSIFTYIFYKYSNKNSNINENMYSNDVNSDNINIRKPTLDNPFMNANIVTKENPDHHNDNIFNNEVQNQIDDYYYKKVVRDIGDVYDKSHSQRQFYTMPSTTIPNQQDDFANWLYGSAPSCKDNQRYCLRTEDPRFISY